MRVRGARPALSVRIATTREHLPAVIALVGELLREPAFPAEALEELKRQALTAIERSARSPSALVANALRRHGNPYPRGDVRHVPHLRRDGRSDVAGRDVEQLRDFHAPLLRRAHAEFGAVGDFDPAAVRAGARRPPSATGEAGAPLHARAAAAGRRRRPQRLHARHAGQAERHPAACACRCRSPTPTPTTRRCMLANHLLGSGGNSRLWKRIRERRACPTACAAGIDWNPLEREFRRGRASAIFAPQNQGRVEAALRDELARSMRDGFTTAELDLAASGLLSARRLARAQDAGLAGSWSTTCTCRALRLQQRSTRRSSSDAREVNAAWRKYIDPGEVVLGWGGDFKAAP